MGDRSKIEWTEASWNTVYGCDKVSPACAHCYIERTPPYRMRGLRFERGSIPVQLLDDSKRMFQPIRWKKPRRIFVNSLGDTFHDDVPDEYIAMIFAVMAAAPQHTFQVLTKRAERMHDLLISPAFQRLVDTTWENLNGREPGDPPLETIWPLDNVWLGVTAENQRWLDQRIPYLLDTPAVIYWLSIEPMCGPIDLKPRMNRNQCLRCGEVHIGGVLLYDHEARTHGIDWVVVGGESGPGARPMNPVWERQVRQQCAAAGVAYFFKQHGEWAPASMLPIQPPTVLQYMFSDGTEMLRVGRRIAGRLVDGQEWNQYPGGGR